MRKSLAMYEQLATEDPNDANTRKDLAQSHRNVARVLWPMKDIASALDHNGKAVAIFRDLVAADPAERVHAPPARARRATPEHVSPGELERR